jgi:hypothetical protein
VVQDGLLRLRRFQAAPLVQQLLLRDRQPRGVQPAEHGHNSDDIIDRGVTRSMDVLIQPRRLATDALRQRALFHIVGTQSSAQFCVERMGGRSSHTTPLIIPGPRGALTVSLHVDMVFNHSVER